MEMYYIFEDGRLIAATPEKNEAITLIRTYQAKQTHPFLKAEYSLIKGVMEYL